jgi:hypothetical protein
LEPNQLHQSYLSPAEIKNCIFSRLNAGFRWNLLNIFIQQGEVEMQQLMAIAEIKKKPSRHGGRIYIVTLIGLEDRGIYETYIDPENRNYKFWRHIIENPGRGYIVSGARLADRKIRPNLVTADSEIIIERETFSTAELAEAIEALWINEDRRTRH